MFQHRSVDVCQSEGAQRLMTNLPTAIEECGEPTTHTFATNLDYVNCAMVKLEIGEECEQGPMSECGLAEATTKAAALRDQLYKIGLPGKLILGDYFQEN